MVVRRSADAGEVQNYDVVFPRRDSDYSSRDCKEDGDTHAAYKGKKGEKICCEVGKTIDYSFPLLVLTKMEDTTPSSPIISASTAKILAGSTIQKLVTNMATLLCH